MRDAATTLLEHARALRDSGAVEGALTAYRRLIARFNAYHGIEIRLPVAMAMADLGALLIDLDQPGEAMTMLDSLLAREEDSRDSALRDTCEQARRCLEMLDRSRT
jgi:hypothetical protein